MNQFEVVFVAFLPFPFEDKTFLIILDFIFPFLHGSFMLFFAYNHDPMFLLNVKAHQLIKSKFLKDFPFLKECNFSL